MFHKLPRPLPLAAATLGVLLLAASSARAGNLSYTLQDLLNGQSVQIGPMTFTNFSKFSSVSYGGAQVDPNQVTVTIVNDHGDFGLAFTGNGQFQLKRGTTQLTHFEFDVITTPPDHVSSATLASATTGGNNNGGGLSGAATILDKVSGLPGGLVVSTIKGIDWTHKDLPFPVTFVHVSRDVVLDGKDGGIALDGFSSTFQEAPEPATATLLGLGILGLAGAQWRRFRKGR